jgi:ornithine cyclodeaminase
LVAHAEGRTSVPPPIHLTFPADDGDAHVKAGWLDGSDDFAVKIATGFYRNDEHGLPTNHGLVCLCSARTGEVEAIVDDRGLLTALRTAAAGALAAHAMARPDARTLGVFGTGEQARLGARRLAELRPVDRILVHGRDPAKVAALCAELPNAVPATVEQAAGADRVLTATPAATPLFDVALIRPGAHVTGIGADMPHKNELPAALFARAALVATDDHAQCLHSGDFGHAVRAGAVAANADVALGAILRDPPPRPADAITIADLTGVGALDAAVASAVADASLSARHRVRRAARRP